MMKFSFEIFDVLFHLRMFLPIALLEVFFWPNENVYKKKKSQRIHAQFKHLTPFEN